MLWAHTEIRVSRYDYFFENEVTKSMKRPPVVFLLALVAVATILATTSCKALPTFGGPNMPDQKGVLFVDLGSGWKPASSLPGVYVGMYIDPQMFNNFGPNDVYRVDHWSNWENNTNKIPINGDRVKVAYRLTEEDKTMQGLVAMSMGSIVIQGLDKRSEELVACPSWANDTPDVDLLSRAMTLH